MSGNKSETFPRQGSPGQGLLDPHRLFYLTRFISASFAISGNVIMSEGAEETPRLHRLNFKQLWEATEQKSLRFSPRFSSLKAEE